jgi:hypothetical protein
MVGPTVDADEIQAGSLGASVMASSVAANSVYAITMADDDHGDVSWTSNAATVDNVAAANVAAGSLGASVLCSSVTPAAVGSVSDSLDDTDASIEWEDAADLESDGSLSADTVSTNEMADADHGDVSWSDGSATVDNVAAANVAAGSLGASVLCSSVTPASVGTVSDNLDDSDASVEWEDAADLESDGSLSDDVVAAAEMADADHGDVSWSDGSATVDNVAAANIAAGSLGASVMASSIAASAIDISLHTNLTAGDHITLTDDDLDVDDDFLLNTGDAGTGAYDFGGADSLEIPNAAGPTVNATGEIALDTTNNQIVLYDGSSEQVVAVATLTFTCSISSPSTGNWDSNTIPIGKISGFYAVTVTSVTAELLGTSTPSLDFNIEERAGGTLNSAGTDMFSSDQTADADGISITSFSNAGIAKDAHLVVTTGASASSGDIEYLVLTIEYRIDRE